MSQSIQLVSKDSTAVLTLSGRVVAEDTDTLQEHLANLSKNNASVKAIDFTGIEYIDSHALGQIIFHCTRIDGTVYIVNRRERKNGFVDRLIEVSDLGQIFTIVEALPQTGASTPGPGA